MDKTYSWGDGKPAQLAPRVNPLRLVFDIETDGLLEQCTKVHCLVATDYDTGEVHAFRPHQIREGIKLLEQADELIGHNIIGFDIRALKKLYPNFKPKGVIWDTLVIAKVIWSDIKETDFSMFRKGKLSAKNIGRHSLKAWGERIQLLKDDFGETTDWKEFSEEMLTYCIQDVAVNCKLYSLIEKKEFPKDALKMEQDIHRICLEQEEFGFPFNVDKAQRLLGKLMKRKAELDTILGSALGPGWIHKQAEVIPTKSMKYKDPLKGNVFKDAAYTKVKFIEFNPNSRTHLARMLQERFGWEPKEFGDDGNPTLSEDVLDKLSIPIAKDISEYLMIGKRIGQLAEGKQAWMSLEVDGFIHGRVNTGGTATRRCSHNSPNLAQIPANRAPYGHDCRELFEALPDEFLLGCDVSGLELRMLAHYMAKWDAGKYGEVILTGDIHSVNQIAAGLPTRDNAKTFIYGFLYGAGDAKIAEIIRGTSKQGKALKERFLKNTPALKSLRDAVSAAVEAKGMLRSIDGANIPVRHQHAALNTLLQSAGAIVCKMWVVRFHELMAQHGYVHGRDYFQAAFVHDELQIRCKRSVFTYEMQEINGKKHFKCLVGELCVQAIRDTGAKLGCRIPLSGEYVIGQSYAETH